MPHDALPRLKTRIPGPKSRTLARQLRRYESRNVTYISKSWPIFWERALGANVWDVDANRYTDPDRYRYADADPDADPDRYPERADEHSDADTDDHIHLDANGHTVSDQHANADPHPHRHTDRPTFRDADRNPHADQHSDRVLQRWALDRRRPPDGAQQ